MKKRTQIVSQKLYRDEKSRPGGYGVQYIAVGIVALGEDGLLAGMAQLAHRA